MQGKIEKIIKRERCMIFFYVDESGTGLKDPRNPYFVLGCIAIDSHNWGRIDTEVYSLKRRLIPWARTEDWEIKGRSLRRGDDFFSNQNWQERAQAFQDISEIISEFPCRLFAVQVDKRLLPRSVETDPDLYRLAFWRLLDELNLYLVKTKQDGVLMFDMRSSSIHSSIQDRRLIDVYREWLGVHADKSQFVELPWFGFSEFYSCLQLADFVSYLVDFSNNENEREQRSEEIYKAFRSIERKLNIFKIP
jgi:hypothetical protein